MPYANNKNADQPARQHRLISAFVVYCTWIENTPNYVRLRLASVNLLSMWVCVLPGRTSWKTSFLVMWLFFMSVCNYTGDTRSGASSPINDNFMSFMCFCYNQHNITLKSHCVVIFIIFDASHITRKPVFRGVLPGKTQTGLLSLRS